MKNSANDRHLELRGRDFRDLGAELLVPVGTELRAPKALRSAAAVVRTDDKPRELPDAEGGGALIEGEFHSGRRFRTNAGASIQQDFRVTAQVVFEALP